MMTLQAFLLIISILALYYGAEMTLETAEKIGLSLNLSPLVIGLLIVGFGTSLPELFVSHSAAVQGQFPMAIGNIVGSNIANILLIMGFVGVVSKLPLVKKDIYKQLVFHFFLTILLCLVLLQESLSWVSALALVFFFIVYLKLNVKSVGYKTGQKRESVGIGVWIVLFFGFALLYGGGKLLVYSGRNLGDLLGISTFVISAIFVAFGTSFPELVTSMVAVKKRKNFDLIVGNLLGSNVFNVSFVLSSLALYQVPLMEKYLYDALTLLVLALFLLGMSLLKKNVGRGVGLSFLILYGLTVARWLGGDLT